MSKEGNHHYVPQFHLAMWKNAEGNIRQWGRIPHNNKLVCTNLTTAATAYVPGLYSIAHVSAEEMQQIETKLFGKIDMEAKPVLEKLISQGPAGLSDQERYWWTIYLNASLLRVPHIVKKLKADAQERIAFELSQSSPEYDAAKGNQSETTLLEWALKHAPARVANSGLNMLVRMVESEKAINRIIHLKWYVRDVSSAPRPLILGDNPFWRHGDLYKPRTLISIPLSPTHIFFASDALDILVHFDQLSAREVVKRSNESTLMQAKKFVYGKAERNFVEMHLPRH